MIKPLLRRPKLLSAIAAGAVVAAALSFIPHGPEPTTSAILGWDVTCLWFVGLTVWAMTRAGPADIRSHAALQDEGRHVILALAVAAAAAGFAGVAYEFSLASQAAEPWKGLHIALAIATVALSWLFTQLIFTVHYAHEFYGGDGDGKARRGLKFPGEADPDYWDFLHFAVVIGVANQTADVAFTTRAMRRIGTIHGVVAFVFNTAVLALTVNLAATLFS